MSSIEGQEGLAITSALISQAVDESSHLGDSATVDEDLCRVVAQRLWLIVLQEKQEHHLTLGEEMAARVREGLIGGTSARP